MNWRVGNILHILTIFSFSKNATVISYSHYHNILKLTLFLRIQLSHIMIWLVCMYVVRGTSFIAICTWLMFRGFALHCNIRYGHFHAFQERKLVRLCVNCGTYLMLDDWLWTLKWVKWRAKGCARSCIERSILGHTRHFTDIHAKKDVDINGAWEDITESINIWPQWV
jgi:hypothetical protein